MALGAVAWTVLALARGETVSALWVLFAALCSHAIEARRDYLRHCAEHGYEPMSRREFERRRADERERNPVGRCC